MVVVAAFFVQFIVCGITYSIGLFHPVFRQVFEHDHFDTSWVGSILLYVTAVTSKYHVVFHLSYKMSFCFLTIPRIMLNIFVF